MEPLESNYLTSKTDIIDSENIECRTPSPLNTCTGSDCSVSTTKIVYDAEAVDEERNDEIVRLTGRLIEVPNGPDESSASESGSSIVSSASTLKSRLHNLPPSGKAVKLANRVTALNERIRRERDLYLHLQGLGNRIEENDEGELSTTDSSKTVNSTSKHHHHGHFSNARARRRERLNSGSAILQHQINSDLQLRSPGFSSPEPLTLREIHEDWIEGMDQLPSPIKHRYSFRNENLATARSNSSITQEFETADEVTSSCQKASQFSKQSYRAVSSDCENSTPLVNAPAESHGRTPNFRLDNADDLKDGLANYELSSEAQNANFQATATSSTSLDYPYVTRKRAPMKFGGYRPSSGLVLRSLSSDSESDATSNRIMNRELRRQRYPQGNRAVLELHDTEKQELQHTADFTASRFTPGPDRIVEVKPYSVDKMEVLEGRPLSPVVSVDSRHFFDNSNFSHGLKSHSELQVPEESGWAPIPLNGKSHLLDSDIENGVQQNTLVDRNAYHRHNAQFTEGSFSNPFNEDKEAYISKLRREDKRDENFFQPSCPINFPEESLNGLLPSLQSLHLCIGNSAKETETLFLRKEARPSSHGPENVHPTISKSDTKAPGITNRQFLPVSVRSLPEDIENFENLRDGRPNHSYTLGDDNVHPKIPPLDIHSHDPSQSHSLSSEDRGDETARSSLDVNALIQALSDVSLKQNASTNDKVMSSIGLKSPPGHGNRFSGSSCPRSSEYTPAVGGSRQSLTSLEASETHSARIPKEESRARGEATSSLKSNEQSTRSASTAPAVSKDLERSEPSTKLKKSSVVKSIPLAEPKLEIDLSRECSFIPVVAKVNRTNLVCSKHPMKIKSVSKLISPRKYRSTDIKEEISDPLTTRTDVSQSSDGTRKSFRSLKSAQLVTRVPRTKIDGLKSKTDNTILPAPLSAGRRFLEPLKACPKIKPDLLTSMNQRLERRKKIANDLSEIINSQSEDSCERTMTVVSSRNSTRGRRLSRTNKTDLGIPCLPQHRENSMDQRNRSTINDSRISSGRRTPEKTSNINSRPSTKEDHKVMGNAVNDQKYFGVSGERRSVTSSNVLYLRSDRLSMSSGDCEGKQSWSPSPRDEVSTEHDKTYDSEDKIDDQQQTVRHTNRKTMSEVMNLDTQSIRLSNVTADSLTKSFKNCVHLDDLQDGKEVTLTCGLTECREANLRKIELFNRLPDEISGSLTRRVSYGTQVTENFNSTNETPFTIEDLRRNIQENNDRWIKGFISDEDLEDSVPRSAGDKISSADSNEQNQISQSQNLLSNVTEISQEKPNVDRGGFHMQETVEGTEGSCSRNSAPGEIDSRRSDSSPMYKYRDTRQESERNGQPGRRNSQRSSLVHSGTNSQQNTFRSLAESTDSTTLSEFDETHECEVSEGNLAPKITEPSPIESGDFTEEQARILSTKKDKIAPADSPAALFSIHPAESNSNADKPDKRSPNISTDTKIHPDDDDDVEVVEALLPKIAELDSTSNRPLELYSQSKMNNIEMFDEDCEKSEEESCHREIHSGHKLGDHEPSKMSSPSCTRSAKSQTLTQHHKNTISSPVSIKSFSSMSKLNSSPDSKWEAKVVLGANIVKKSQDRFPFTISESATRKSSKFKIVADVNLDQLMQDQNAHAGRNDAFLSQKLIPAKSGDQRMIATDTIDTEKRIDCSEESPVRQLTPLLEEFRNKISDDSPDNWDTRIPFNGLNYMSYGCREEPKALMPSVKEMVKKISAKLGYARRKRCLDPEETKVEILYRNKKCRYESGEGSSSAASLYQSQQLLNTSNKLVPSFVRRSTGSSKASSVKKMTPKRNHEHISMFMQHSPRKGCDRNDLWIQEFDSDVEFDSQVGYCRMQNDLKREIMPRTSSPVNDPYSMFMARSKSSGDINKTDHNDQRSKMNFVSNFCDGEDNKKVNSNKRSGIDDELSIKVPEMVLKSPRTPANSLNDSNNEFKIHAEDENFEDSSTKRGCCCFNVYHLFVEHSSKTREAMKISKKK